MRVFLAGEFPMQRLHDIDKLELFFSICTDRLFSYFYHPKPHDEEVREYVRRGVRLFLDSGAFTAWTKKVEIPIPEYADFIKQTGFWYPTSNLDVIGDDGEKSFANQLALEDLLGPDVIMPVFHLRDNFKWLDKIMERNPYYIALGGLVGAPWHQVEPWLNKVWQAITDSNGRPLVRCHGFGLTTVKAITGYPWYSVDSSSWMQTAIYGSCLFVGKRPKPVKVVFSELSPEARKLGGWHFFTLPAKQQEEVRSWLEPYDVTPEQCAEYWGYRCVVNAQGFNDLSALAPKQFKQTQETLF